MSATENPLNLSIELNLPLITPIMPPLSRIKKYPKNSKGPFIVFIRKKDVHLDPLSLQKHVFQNFKSCTKAYSINEFKLRFEFSNIDDANAAVNDEFLNKHKVYVPADSVEIRGIISLPVGCDENALLKGVGKFSNPNITTVPILEVYRFTKKGTKDPIGRVKITFEGSCLPEHILLDDHFLIKVQPYLPRPFFCEKCLDYGHSLSYCTKFKQKCRKCGEDHSQSECQSSTTVCRHCKGPHLTGSDLCPTSKRVQQRSDRFQFTRIRNRYSELMTETEHDNTADTDLNQTPSESTPMETQTSSTNRKRPLSSPSSQPPPKRDNRSFASVVAQSQVPKSQQNTASRPSTSKMPPTQVPHLNRSKLEIPTAIYKFIENMVNNIEMPAILKDLILQFLPSLLENVWSQLFNTVAGYNVSTHNHA